MFKWFNMFLYQISQQHLYKNIFSFLQTESLPVCPLIDLSEIHKELLQHHEFLLINNNIVYSIKRSTKLSNYFCYNEEGNKCNKTELHVLHPFSTIYQSYSISTHII